jgi:hypothetical protein
VISRRLPSGTKRRRRPMWREDVTGRRDLTYTKTLAPFSLAEGGDCSPSVHNVG